MKYESVIFNYCYVGRVSCGAFLLETDGQPELLL